MHHLPMVMCPHTVKMFSFREPVMQDAIVLMSHF
jgi:hypothetical protein